ncbi:MAG: hypothetical protein IJ493_10080 [Clostridia bacterium]|nr:hypothetical protein [Clostridia bacterium]
MKQSLLWLTGGRRELPASLAADLNLHKLLPERTITLLSRLCTTDEIAARQDIFRRLEDTDFLTAVHTFADSLTRFSQASDAWNAAKNDVKRSELEEIFLLRRLCEAQIGVSRCGQALAQQNGESPFLEALYQRMEALSEENALIRRALADSQSAEETLSTLSMRMEGGGVFICRTMNPDSLTAKIEAYAEAMELPCKKKSSREIRILPALSEALAKLYSAEFASLRQCSLDCTPHIDRSLTDLRGEIEFYLSITDLISRGRKQGFAVCYPSIVGEKRFSARDAYDFTLLVKNCAVVANDIDFDADAPVCFLTGANGGGKTTYLRCAAANLLLALCGCPVFAAEMCCYPFDYICTHFPADESFTGSGRLVEEAARVDSLLQSCTADSFIFFNETYSGTDDIKGARMTLETASRVRESGAYSLWVTHFHEVADGDFVMLTTVMDETDTANRTFRIRRAKGGGSSYAADILRKYKLDAASLRQREEDEYAKPAL